MGTFGNDIFQDDLSLDIKIRFEELLEEGLEYEELIDSIISEFEDSFEDFDEVPTAVLALSSLIVEKDFKSERLKNELDRIRSDKDYWDYLKEENSELYESRLEKLREVYNKI